MAAVLRCPDCGHRHPLGAVTALDVFRCEECGRALKVPQSLRTEVAEPPPPERPVGRGVTARPMPSEGPGSKLLPPLHVDAPEAELAPLGWGWRLLIWVVAVPVGAVGGGLLANAFGLVTLSQLEDTMLGSGYRRYDPLMRFVPFWALVTALFVTAAVASIEALRRRRAERGAHPAAEPQAAAAEPNAAAADQPRSGLSSEATAPSTPSRRDADTEPSPAVAPDGEAGPVGGHAHTEQVADGSDADEVARSEAE